MPSSADFSSDRPIHNVRFNHASSQLFLSYYEGHFAVVDVGSRSVVATHDFPGVTRSEILHDPISGLCGVSVIDPVTNKSEVFVFDPATFVITQKIKVATDCFLYDNTLYTSTKFALPL